MFCVFHAGPQINWKPGRSDQIDDKACPEDGRLPDGAKGAPHVRDIFYRMGFNDQEIVALSGACWPHLHCLCSKLQQIRLAVTCGYHACC